MGCWIKIQRLSTLIDRKAKNQPVVKEADSFFSDCLQTVGAQDPWLQTPGRSSCKLM
jgi:hypothetical protein